jgi:hypothetical protein
MQLINLMYALYMFKYINKFTSFFMFFFVHCFYITMILKIITFFILLYLPQFN